MTPTPRLFASALVAALALPGCYDTAFEEFDTTCAGAMEGGGEGASACLKGDLGAVAGFHTTAKAEVSQPYVGWRQLELHAQDASRPWAVMAQITVDGRLSRSQFYPGARMVFEPYGRSYGTEIRVMGCSGRVRDSWTFDRTAERVVVRVEEGPRPGVLRMVFAAYFEDTYSRYATDSVQGSFEFQPE